MIWVIVYLVVGSIIAGLMIAISDKQAAKQEQEKKNEELQLLKKLKEEYEA